MFWKTVLKVLESIFSGLLALAGAVCVSPFIFIGILIGLPADVISDIWSK